MDSKTLKVTFREDLKEWVQRNTERHRSQSLDTKKFVCHVIWQWVQS